MAEPILCDRCRFEPGNVIDGKYHVDKALGEGTYGCVYRVFDADGNVYALKLLKLWEVVAQEREELLKRFDLEYETGRIDSRYLVHSLGRGTVGGNPYILMEYCDGGDLWQAALKGSVDFKTVGRHILLGLQALHNRGKVHRDLKPENVLLHSDGTAVLTDFGISGDQNKRLTQRGIFGVPKQMFGTFAYMPPEQINPKRGNATVLPTTDIFSYGVMMYQLLTGELPFGDLDSEADLPAYISKGKSGLWNRDKLNAMPGGGEWMQLIEGCLVADYRQRFSDVDSVLAVLPQPAPGFGQPAPQYKEENTPSFKTDSSKGLVLHVMEGENHGMKYFITLLSRNLQRNMLTIGRESDDVFNHIRLTETMSTYISRCHATLEYRPDTDSWLIRDGQWRVDCPVGKLSREVYPCTSCPEPCHNEALRRLQWKKSLNGTYVGSQEVDMNGTFLKIGDIITIGDVKMRIEGM